jgi:hypothetical protein
MTGSHLTPNTRIADDWKRQPEGSAREPGVLSPALVHPMWPHPAIGAVTLGLNMLAAAPWPGPIFESLELPGGWQFKFQQLQRAGARAQEAGLVGAPPIPAATVRPA